MISFDVRIFAIRRRPGRRASEVRWRVAGHDKSRSFLTRALADSYRAELVRAARKGTGFDPATGEPATWRIPEPVTVTWYQLAVAYADVKWPHLAAHSRASIADALATLTPTLTAPRHRPPPARELRAALYLYAFNPRRRSRPDPAAAGTLAWLERASMPVSALSDPQVIRAALDGLCTRMDGKPAAANTISRKRAVFHGALGYAAELGLLPANPMDKVQWRARPAAAAVSPAVAASPAQVRAILSQVLRIRPDLAAFFGCLYYAALRPEEAVALRRNDLSLPAADRGTITLSTACPRTGTAWTSTGTPHETRGLKHRPDGTIRTVPVPTALARMLRWHLGAFGTTADGRLFRGTRGGILSESSYARTWQAARQAALSPELAATPLARRPYDLRHAALSLWLNATSAPAEIATRAGTSTRVLHDVYQHCICHEHDLTSQQIDQALSTSPASQPPSQPVTANGPPDRYNAKARPPYVRQSQHRPAHSPRNHWP